MSRRTFLGLALLASAGCADSGGAREVPVSRAEAPEASTAPPAETKAPSAIATH